MRTLTGAIAEAVLAQETGVVIQVLFEITGEDISEPVRLVVGSVTPVTSNGDLFNPAAADMTFPPEGGSELGTMRFVLDDLNSQFYLLLDGIHNPPEVEVWLIGHEEPDARVAMGKFEWLQWKFDTDTGRFESQLKVENFLFEGYPSKIFNPFDFPGLTPP